MTPRLGFLGVGWIGRHRMSAIADAGVATVAAVADVDAASAAAAAAPYDAPVVAADDLLRDPSVHRDLGLDGLVIATPSAGHAAQAIEALGHGLAVFCQKPLGRSADETARVVDAARDADRLLGVDLSYRHLAAIAPVRELLRAGELGDVYAADLVFHNAYGPDKPWFTDVAQSGGGCVIDLGIHLVDLAMWLLDRPKVDSVTSRLYSGGRPLDPSPRVVEDYATARLDLATGATVTLTCSWFLHAGVDADIAVTLHGTQGSVEVRNVGGSFYDFTAHHFVGTGRRTLAGPPDAWGGRAATAWARALGDGGGYDDAIADVVDVARVLDRVYGR